MPVGWGSGALGRTRGTRHRQRQRRVLVLPTRNAQQSQCGHSEVAGGTRCCASGSGGCRAQESGPGPGISPHAAILLQGCGTASPGMRFDATAARSELLSPRACWLLLLLSPGSWGSQPQPGGDLSPWGPRDVLVHVKQLPAHWQQAGAGTHTKRTSSSGTGAE